MPELMNQMTQAWLKLTLRQRFTLVASFVLTVGAVAGIVWWARQPNYAVLFTGLDPKDAQSIVAELEGQKVPLQLENGPGGTTTVTVPYEQVDRLRMDLAARNIPQSGHWGFMEMFAQDTIAQSSKTQQMRYQKALEDELSRTIESLDEVRTARVHIVMAGERVFLDDGAVAKASVTLALKGGKALAGDHVMAIARIVAGAVPDLTVEHVSIVDTNGRVLWEGDSEPGGMIAARQVEMKNALETDINAKVQRVLEPVIGAGHFVVRTSADLDFQKVTRHEKQYDPNTGVLISEKKTKEKSSSRAEAAGVPGTASNLPGAAAPTGGGSGEATDRADSLNNFEYSVVEKQVEEPVGGVRRLSVAVVVDQVRPEPVAGGAGADASKTAPPQPRSDEDMKRIESLVKAAISFDASRGDVVTLEQAAFLVPKVEDAPRAFDPLVYLPLVKYPALILLVVLAFFLGVRPLAKAVAQLGAGRAAPASTTGVLGAAESLPGLGTPSRLEVMRQRLSALAEAEPAGMAQTVRVWLHEQRD